MRISDWSSDVCSSDLAQQPLHRHFTKPPVQQLRQVRLTNSDQPRGGALAEAARFQDAVEPAHQLALELVRRRIGKTQIGNQVAAAFMDPVVAPLLSHLARAAWSAAASLNWFRHRTVFFLGVLLPFF